MLSLRLSVVFTAALFASLVSANEQACHPEGTAVDPNRDFFPDKVSPADSQFWSIQYFNTYKILRNADTGTTYLLHQCGTEPPSDQLDGRHAAVVPVPIQGGVAISETPQITYMQQIDKLNEVTVFLTDPSLVSNPCFKEELNAGRVQPVDPNTVGTGGAGVPANLQDIVAFTSPFSHVPWATEIKVSAFREKTNKAIFEWAKFYAAFFNQEALVNQVVLAAATRFDCIAQQSSQIITGAPKGRILWAYWSDFCQGWDVGSCPNYYCEYASACKANILSSTDGSVTTCGVNYMTTDELVAFGQTAGYWLYPSSNWDAVYAREKAKLDTMKAVQEQRVFDFQGSGQNAWFESRFVQYYDVMQDVCNIMGTARPLMFSDWFRNVFTDRIGNPGTCMSNQGPTFPFVDLTCPDPFIPPTRAPTCQANKESCTAPSQCCSALGCYGKPGKAKKCASCAMKKRNCQTDRECCDFSKNKGRCDTASGTCIKCGAAGKKCKTNSKCCSRRCGSDRRCA